MSGADGDLDGYLGVGGGAVDEGGKDMDEVEEDEDKDACSDGGLYSDGYASPHREGNRREDPEPGSDTHSDADWEPLPTPERSSMVSDHERTAVSSFQVCEDEVAAFLHELDPDMQELTPRFIEGGLVNLRCLIALARMLPVDRQQLLRDDMELTAFQARVICIGLAQLGSR